MIELLFDLNEQHGTTLILVTHDGHLASRCDRIYRMEAGELKEGDIMSAVSSSEATSTEQNSTTQHSSNKSLIRWSFGEIRQGNLWPISVALILVIASIFALSALAERMEQVIVKQGKDALTADAVFVSANPIPDTLLTSTENP
ncbi:putative ABC transporter ATP-binding protein YbbA [Vibrio alginolyticus]|nr:putative ABC transporter ATP-binding protein YbbA [Vibrio alginolyticus]